MIDYGAEVPNYLECLPNTLFVENIEYGERKTSKAGLIIPTESMDYQGHFVRPRWAKVKYKADNIKNIEVGDWICCQHAHWSTSLNITINGKQQKIWYINPKCYKEGIIAKSKTMPSHLKEYGIEE